MLHFMFFLMFGTSPNANQAHRDSLVVYNLYNGSIYTLKNCTDYLSWYKLEDSLVKTAAAALGRLAFYNNQPYEAIQELNKEGYGVAYSFPVPGYAEPIAFSIIDKQTKFLVNKLGRTVTPYIERSYFADNYRLIKIEKLNPVTLVPILPEFVTLLVIAD